MPLNESFDRCLLPRTLLPVDTEFIHSDRKGEAVCLSVWEGAILNQAFTVHVFDDRFYKIIDQCLNVVFADGLELC